jgi:hypothetical protein
MANSSLSRSDMLRLFDLLNTELATEGAQGELYLVGGAAGEEFHDLDDVRYLLRYLNITGVEEALEVVTRYFDAERLPPKTRLALEELLAG